MPVKEHEPQRRRQRLDLTGGSDTVEWNRLGQPDLADLKKLSIRVDRARVNGAAGARASLPIDDAAHLELTLRVDAPPATLDRKLAARFEGVRRVGA